jgi:hypothetical protein
VFLSEERPTPGQGLGFAAVGFRAVSVADPSGDPGSWQVVPVPTRPPPYDATANVACTASDGGYLYAMFSNTTAHDGHIARWPLVALQDLSSPEWWDGGQWSTTANPAVVLHDGATECSLQRIDGTWIYVQSRGFGATTIAIRTAPRLEGPWSEPLDAFTPPESQVPSAFVYAGKGHPTIVAHETGANLVVTYADNSLTFSDLFDPARESTLYWPHVAELALH